MSVIVSTKSDGVMNAGLLQLVLEINSAIEQRNIEEVIELQSHLHNKRLQEQHHSIIEDIIFTTESVLKNMIIQQYSAEIIYHQARSYNRLASKLQALSRIGWAGINKEKGLGAFLSTAEGLPNYVFQNDTVVNLLVNNTTRIIDRCDDSTRIRAADILLRCLACKGNGLYKDNRTDNLVNLANEFEEGSDIRERTLMVLIDLGEEGRNIVRDQFPQSNAAEIVQSNYGVHNNKLCFPDGTEVSNNNVERLVKGIISKWPSPAPAPV